MPARTAPLSASSLRGVWAAVTMFWTEGDAFDETSYIANLRRCIKAGVHGVYTTGSTGEFYAVEHDEFRRMVDIQAELCGAARMPLQIGCCSDSTRKTLRLLEYAASKPAVGAAQVVVPYWMELSDGELLQFFKDVARAVPDLPIVHYNIPRAKRFLLGPDYQRLRDVVLNLIGVKFAFAGTNFLSLQEAIRLTPEIAYFAGEPLLASAMQLGARGCYSSLVMTNPRFMLDFYAAGEAKDWERAMGMQRKAAAYFADIMAYVRSLGEATSDPAFDKGMALAAGFFSGHPRCRAPYFGWTEAGVAKVRDWLQTNHPEFMFDGV